MQTVCQLIDLAISQERKALTEEELVQLTGLRPDDLLPVLNEMIEKELLKKTGEYIYRPIVRAEGF